MACILRTGTMRVSNCSVMNSRRTVDKPSNLSNPGMIESLQEISNNVPHVTKAKHPLLHQFQIDWQVYSISTADYILTQVGYKLVAIQLSKRELCGAAYLLKSSAADISGLLYTLQVPGLVQFAKSICEEPRETLVLTHYSSLAFFKSRPSQREDSPL